MLLQRTDQTFSFAETFTETADEFHLLRDEFGLLPICLFFISNSPRSIAVNLHRRVRRTSRRTGGGVPLLPCRRHSRRTIPRLNARQNSAFDAKLHRLLNTRLDLASVGMPVIFYDWIDDATDDLVICRSAGRLFDGQE